MRRSLAVFAIFCVLQGCQQIEGIWKNPKTFSLESRSCSLSAESQDYLLNLECDKEWTAELAGGTWATVSGVSSNGSKGLVTIHVDANGTEQAREDTLTVCSGFLEERFYLRQQDVTTIISRTHLTVDDKRGDSFSIHAGGFWSIGLPDAPDWLGISSTQGRGDADITVRAKEKNLNSGERNTVMRVTVNDDLFLVTVTQKQTDAILADRAKVELGNKAQTFTIDLQSNVGYSVKVDCPWISIVESKALDSSSVTFSAQANTEETPRDGSIIFSGGTVSETVFVSQAGKDVLVLGTPGSSDPGKLEIPFNGGSRAIELRSNVEYDIIMPQVPWIRLQSMSDRKAVMRVDAIGIVVSANVSEQPREAEIVVKDRNSNLQASVTIRQDGMIMPAFAVQTDIPGFYKGDGTPVLACVPSQTQTASGKDFEFGRYFRVMLPAENRFTQVSELPDGEMAAGDSFGVTVMQDTADGTPARTDAWLMVIRTEGGLTWMYDFNTDLGIIARL